MLSSLFHNPKSNVALPHVGLLMPLFNDCQDLWRLFVIYGLRMRRAHTAKHALYLQFDLISLCLGKGCHKLQESHGARHCEAL